MAPLGLSPSRPSNPASPGARPASSRRLYFDLHGFEQTIPDVTGIEVSDLAQARRTALEMIRQLRQDDPALAQDWSGWTLRAVDAAGFVVFAIALDGLLA
jgi:hypothetical protein